MEDKNNKKKKSNKLRDYLFSKNVIELITIASEYCGFIEKVNLFSKRDFLSKTQKLLSLLYLKTAILNSHGRIEGEELEQFVSELQYNHLQEQMAFKLGEHDLTVSFYENNNLEDSQLVNVVISECLADIYQELRDFIGNYQLGNHRTMLIALRECQANFETFWGQRAISTIATLHNIIYSGEDLREESNTKKEDNANWLINKHLQQYKS